MTSLITKLEAHRTTSKTDARKTFILLATKDEADVDVEELDDVLRVAELTAADFEIEVVRQRRLVAALATAKTYDKASKASDKAQAELLKAQAEVAKAEEKRVAAQNKAMTATSPRHLATKAIEDVRKLQAEVHLLLNPTWREEAGELNRRESELHRHNERLRRDLTSTDDTLRCLRGDASPAFGSQLWNWLSSLTRESKTTAVKREIEAKEASAKSFAKRVGQNEQELKQIAQKREALSTPNLSEVLA